MSLDNIQYSNRLYPQGLEHTMCISGSKSSEISGISSFSDILSEACKEDSKVGDMFQAAFPNYHVQTKAGNCNVPWESWDRNDFPIWEYFKKDTKADCLNNWRPVGPEPPQTDRNVQKGLSQVDYGEMVILMPESLQKKMESDPAFAEEVLKKVQKWKEDYDKKDNAIAASLGYDPELNQLSKSYCIQLDENGNVGDYTVLGGGFDDPGDSSTIKIGEHDHLILRKSERKVIQSASDSSITTEDYRIDFESIAPYLMEIRRKK